MNTMTFAYESPIISLLYRGMNQTWKPLKGDGYCSSIVQINAQSIICQFYVLSFWNICFNRRSIHSTPPTIMNCYSVFSLCCECSV